MANRIRDLTLAAFRWVRSQAEQRPLLTTFALFATLTVVLFVFEGRQSAQQAQDSRAQRDQIVASNQRHRSQICNANTKLASALHSSLHLLTTEENIAASPAVAEIHDGFHAILTEAVPDFCGQDLLGPHREQNVHNRIEGQSGPALRYGETTRITGTLCSKTEEPLSVLTTITWQAVDRTGTFVTAGVDVPQVREPGCVSYEFRNPMPAEVVSASDAIRADGGAAVWVVTGFEVPQLPDGSRGARQEFTSEPFEIVP